MGFSGPQFTWKRGNLLQRLDRALCNSRWEDFAPNYSVQHLYRLKSDHRPILVSFGVKTLRGEQRPFRFIASWLLHLEFKDLVNTHWGRDRGLALNLKQLTLVLKNWNKEVYEIIFYTHKKKLFSELGKVQKILEVRRSAQLMAREVEICSEIDDLLKHEELLWFQISRATWLDNGNRNTKYFHDRMMARRRSYKVEGLKIDEGDGVLMMIYYNNML